MTYRAFVFGFIFAGFGTAAVADIKVGLEALNAGNAAVAASEFQKSFQEGEGDGAFYLGRLFEFGIGTDKDMTRAANLYAAAATAGSVKAMNRLGLLYLEGKVLLRDYKLASDNFCKAADLGDENGQLNCALMYKDGRGVELDAAKAADYLAQAGDQGNIAARNILGQMLMAGDGIAADPARALALFEQTADAGNAMGLYELAKVYSADADGATPDLVKAYSFANLAAVRQHKDAATLRDQLEERMTPAQVVSGQQMSQKWTSDRIAAQANTASE